jgi:hypothetical protein
METGWCDFRVAPQPAFQVVYKQSKLRKVVSRVRYQCNSPRTKETVGYCHKDSVFLVLEVAEAFLSFFFAFFGILV